MVQSGPVYVAGHRGLVGSALWRALATAGQLELIGATSAELDLRDRQATFDFVAQHRPTTIIMAAARVGGIMANQCLPADFLSDNLRIQLNLMDAAVALSTPRLIFLGSSCIYPKLAVQPIRESALLTGRLEPTNDAYAIAKIAGVLQVQSIRRQYGLPYISAMPTNLYGPGDNFDAATSHVLPALIRKFHEAKVEGHSSVRIWGTGQPRREFLHVDDAAGAILHLLEHYDHDDPINVGTGLDISIADVAALVAEVVGWEGQLVFDHSKPDGTPRKLLDISRIRQTGWAPQISLREGLNSTYAWFVNHYPTGDRPSAESAAPAVGLTSPYRDLAAAGARSPKGVHRS